MNYGPECRVARRKKQKPLLLVNTAAVLITIGIQVELTGKVYMPFKLGHLLLGIVLVRSAKPQYSKNGFRKSAGIFLACPVVRAVAVS